MDEQALIFNAIRSETFKILLPIACKTTPMSRYTICSLTARSVTLLVLALLCMLLSSCVTSIYSLAEGPDDLVYRPELSGTWKETDGNAHILVEPGEERSYAITLVEERSHDSVTTRDTSYFIGRLVQAENYLLMDCLVDLERQRDYRYLGDYTRMGLMPVHFIFHIALRDNNRVLELGQLETKALEQALKARHPAFHYYKEENGKVLKESIMLLEPSASMKKLLGQLLKEGADVWDKSTWERM
jgi:hypothetical protein